MKIDSFQSINCLMLLVLPWLTMEVQSFQILPSQSRLGSSKTNLIFNQHGTPLPIAAPYSPTWRSPKGLIASRSGRDTTKLHMYNLPPGGGRGGGGLGDILKGVAGLILTVAFFASPIGGFILSVVNSFVLLAFLIPTIATLGFQAWQYFNTISGACPNCGAPARVMKTKDGESTPTMCFNCGAVLQASYDNERIDNVTGRNSMNQGGLGGPGGSGSIFDILNGPGASSGSPFGGTTRTSTTIYEAEEFDISSSRSSRPSSSSSSGSGSRKKPPSKKDMGDIIDAEIEDDLPFQ